MSTDQIILVGLIASALTFGLRVLTTYANYRPGRVVVNIVLFVVSAGLALLWSGAALPSFPPFDPNIGVYVAAVWQWANDLVALGTPILGAATLIYNLLCAKVVVPLFARFTKK